jgi:hypothetical protein
VRGMALTQEAEKYGLRRPAAWLEDEEEKHSERGASPAVRKEIEYPVAWKHARRIPTLRSRKTSGNHHLANAL